MPVPSEILAVARPTNTVVIAYGRYKNLFAVRKRARACKGFCGNSKSANSGEKPEWNFQP